MIDRRRRPFPIRPAADLHGLLRMRSATGGTGPAPTGSLEGEPADAEVFVGWFDSSHDLRAGLQVVELGALPEGLSLPLA